jgi:hypothetical protein
MVTGQDGERRLERRQQLTNLFVLDIESVIGQVTGDQHPVRVRLECADAFDRGGKHRDGVPVAPIRADVRITELDKEERSLHANALILDPGNSTRDRYLSVTAVRFIVSSTPGFGSSRTPMTVRAGRWSPIFST